MKPTYRVLLIEDDPAIARTLKMSLPYEDFEVTACDTVRSGRDALQTARFDVVLLDLNLPDGSGLAVCREIRKTDALIPILLVTAKVEETSAVEGLREGADDYVRKPFGVAELAERMRRLLARRKSEGDLPKFGPLKIDRKKRRAWANDAELSLGKREFEILLLLMQKQGDVVTRNEILDVVDEDAEIYERTLDSHLSHLRKKLKEAGVTSVVITPVYGVGYRLEEK